MNIYLYHPSRGRPDQAAKVYETWIQRAYKPCLDHVDGLEYKNIIHVLSLDTDDDRWGEYDSEGAITRDNRTMVEALNRCLLPGDEGIIVTLYDDMVPSEGWADSLGKAYQSGKLFRVDCGGPLQTVCAGCASVFQRWGYVYYPGYVSMFADNDYQEHGEREGLFIDCEMRVTHNHPAHGTAEVDATYQRQNHSAAYAVGQKVLTRRRWSEFSF